jgi:hypothetical protein
VAGDVGWKCGAILSVSAVIASASEAIHIRRRELEGWIASSLSLHKELSSSGLTGRSGTPRSLGSIISVSGILGRPVKPGDDV